MLWKIIGGIIIIVLIIGGFFYWRSAQTTTQPTEEETTTEVTSEEAATPTPEKVDKSKFTIEVQNGSGIEGEAGRAQELLKGDDFNVSGTANADNYDYEETVIQAGSDVSEEWLDLLKETLGKNYKVDSNVEELPEGSDVDVIVIVGSFDEKGESMAAEEEATPTPEEESTDETPTPTQTGTPTPSPTP